MSPRKSELRIGLTVRRTFSVSKANWKKLEKAYGRDIPEQARGKIYTATETMLRGADEEHSGRLSEIIKRITEFKRAASILLALFTAPGDQRSIHFAAECIEVGLTELSNTTFDEYHDYTMAFAGACKRAPDIATSMSVEGTRQAWEIWIKDLTVICARYGWPTGAAKDRSDRPSPFVSFVWELQQLIPRKYLRSTQSSDALAKAINKVERFRIHTRFGTKRARPSKKKSRKHR